MDQTSLAISIMTSAPMAGTILMYAMNQVMFGYNKFDEESFKLLIIRNLGVFAGLSVV